MTTSEPYIINRIQTPYALQVAYDAIAAGHETTDQIKTYTQLTDSQLEESLDGLQLLGLIRRAEHAYEAVDLVRSTGDRALDFRLTAINNLAAEANPDDWGKQAVVLLNYQYLIKEDCQEFENNEDALYEDIDTWLLETTDYRPKGDGDIYTHNDNKFQYWTRLVHFLGLVHKVSGRQHTVYPEPDLVYESIKWASESASYGPDAEADVSLPEYLAWSEENFIRTGYATGKSVPAVLARTLQLLVRDERIQLIEYGDAGYVPLDRVPTAANRGIDAQANSIKIL
jgi:hypothetical protein